MERPPTTLRLKRVVWISDTLPKALFATAIGLAAIALLKVLIETPVIVLGMIAFTVVLFIVSYYGISWLEDSTESSQTGGGSDSN